MFKFVVIYYRVDDDALLEDFYSSTHMVLTEQLPGLRLALLLTGEDTEVLKEATPPYPVLRKPVRPLRLRMLLTQCLHSADPAVDAAARVPQPVQ